METLKSHLSIKIIKSCWVRTAKILCLGMSSYIATLTALDSSLREEPVALPFGKLLSSLLSSVATSEECLRTTQLLHSDFVWYRMI